VIELAFVGLCDDRYLSLQLLSTEVAPGVLLREIDPKDTRSLQRIGELRYRVWEEENAINPELFPNRCWVDSLDQEARHWVLEDRVTGAWMAAARMTLHTTLDDDSRDVQVWRRAGKHLPLPTVDLGRLVVLAAYRGRGLAQLLNTTRIQAARQMSARSVMATASAGNARLLKKLGFEDIGETVYFEDRPDTCFYALQLNL
jgi:predicted GNAT family N-acyltransferase